MILTTSPAIARYTPAARGYSPAEANIGQAATPQPPTQPERTTPSQGVEASPRTPRALEPQNQGLNEDARRVLGQLKARDREVRSHEAAHLAAAGSYATSGASFTYQRGPDGQFYAIGGEVGVDIAKVAGDPQASLEKAEQVRAAALAPASPSPQDRAIAARASQLAAEARREIASAGEAGAPGADRLAAVEAAEESATATASSSGSAVQAYEAVSTALAVQSPRLLDIQV